MCVVGAKGASGAHVDTHAPMWVVWAKFIDLVSVCRFRLHSHRTSSRGTPNHKLLDLGRAPYVLYGVKYINLVPLNTVLYGVKYTDHVSPMTHCVDCCAKAVGGSQITCLGSCALCFVFGLIKETEYSS